MSHDDRDLLVRAGLVSKQKSKVPKDGASQATAAAAVTVDWADVIGRACTGIKATDHQRQCSRCNKGRQCYRR